MLNHVHPVFIGVGRSKIVDALLRACGDFRVDDGASVVALFAGYVPDRKLHRVQFPSSRVLCPLCVSI